MEQLLLFDGVFAVADFKGGELLLCGEAPLAQFVAGPGGVGEPLEDEEEGDDVVFGEDGLLCDFNATAHSLAFRLVDLHLGHELDFVLLIPS